MGFPSPANDYGLSPLARGTPTFSRPKQFRKRFIPAGAGNTAFSSTTSVSTPVYPRWRGEHVTDQLKKNFPNGLSPLARGTLTWIRNPSQALRFIPAGAGNTVTQEKKRLAQAVYPRWRGEHTKDILLFYNSFLSTQQFTNFITTISHY
ncbi:Domain of uncharacterised function (DUF2825) [Klebsiella pneumoniae]|nr:Domain of uncharacterised function (DUF2825) [Klebsiella pneumoniae]